MKLVLHKMHNCNLCHRAIVLLNYWGIPFRPVYDEPKKDKCYPYITIELTYEELTDWIAREKLQNE